MTLRNAHRELLNVPIGLIDPPRLASRATMDETALGELADDMRRNGIISPLSVGRVGDRFEVVAGHRRSLAARMAGLASAPCVVYASVDAAHEAIKFAENKYREDLNPAEEALWFSELLERDCSGDVDKLCELLSIKRTYAEGRLLLFQGDQAIFTALQENKIGIGVAQTLNRCTDEQYRRYLLHQAIAGGATKAVAEGWLQDWQRQAALQTGAPPGAEAAAPTSPVPELNYFVCYVCKGTENLHAMRPINVHDYCRPATLDKALAEFAARGESLKYPRTLDQARELAAALISDFPELTHG